MASDVPQTDFWNYQDKDRKRQEFEEQQGVVNKGPSWKEICLALPSIEHHLDGKAMAKIKKDYEWLEDLEPSSTISWQRLKEEFSKNAPVFLDVLDLFTDSKRIESQIARILSTQETLLIEALLLMCENLKDLHRNIDDCSKHGTGDESFAATVSKISDMDKHNDLTKSRLEELFRKPKFAPSKAHRDRLQTWGDLKLIESRILSSMVQVLWPVNLTLRFFMDRFATALDSYRTYPLWMNYGQMIKAFARQVGCAKSHETPDDNIDELRLFHSTTIGYFSELQAKYLEKELKLKELRRQITALEFRHLMEHLPDPVLGPHAGPRWTKFWVKALEDEKASHEARNAHEAKTKALKVELADSEGHEDQEVKKKGLEEARTRDRKHALTDIMEDRNPDRNLEEVTGQSGTVPIEGARLYNKFSDEIHRYRGTEYRVGEPGDWDVAISDLLKALKPENVQENGDVDWIKERKRYSLMGTATDESDEKAFSWNTAPMRKKIAVLEKDRNRMQEDIGKLKREVKDLKKAEAEDSDVGIENLLSPA